MLAALVTLTAGWMAACVHQPPPAGGGGSVHSNTLRPIPAVPVPASAPDTVPAWIHSPANLATDAEASFSYYADVLTIRFVERATQAQRQAAVDVVRGTVVGGERRPAPEGIYFVRIEAKRRIAPLVAAMRVLIPMPQVAAVSFITLMEESARP